MSDPNAPNPHTERDLHRSREMRQQILEAAMRLFMQYGYHGLAMRQIAEAVGVSKAALYYHFKDKEELFLAMMESYMDALEALLQRIFRETSDSRQRIQMLVREILAQPAERRAMIRLFSQEMSQLSGAARQAFHQLYDRKFLSQVRVIFEDGTRRGELRPLDPNVATWALLGMMFPYFYPTHAQEAPASPEVAGQLAKIFLDGMAVE